jgi:2-hydroxychromene-2-carboxylate isomerase
VLAARVALVALAQDWGEDFCRAVYGAEFGAGRNIGEPTVIADLLKGLGQDADAVLERAQSDATKALLRAQTEQAHKLGIFGAPTFIAADGELFWGNDRLEAALEWVRR